MGRSGTVSVEGIRQDVADSIRENSPRTNIEVIGHVMQCIRVRRDETDYLLTITEAPSE